MTASAGDAYAGYRSHRVFGSLDGLRAACILAVIWHHAHNGFVWLPGSGRGFLGVDMFFVISGFLIVTLLLRERDRNDAISLPRFYARRTLRIFPVYYGVLLALAALYLVRDSARGAQFWSELPYYLTYTSNWIPVTILPLTWSLAAEEQFYLCWPPIERWLRRVAVPLILGFIALNQCVNFGVGIAAPGTWLGERYGDLMILQATFTPIALGVLLAHGLHARGGFTRIYGWLGRPAAAPILVAVLLLAANWPNEDIRGWQRLTIQCVMTALVGACVIREDHGLRRLLTLAPLVRIGVVSYGMYLFHIFVIAGVHALPLPTSSVVGFALAAAGTFVVAEASFRGFESRFLAWKGRFAT